MSIEYRAARPDELQRFAYASRVGFGLSTVAEEVERLVERSNLRAEWTLAAWEDGEPVAQMGAYPLRMNWNGRDIACSGVTAVTTLPTHRRRGHLRELMTRHFAAMRDRGEPVAMLWASMAAIYQRFGYGIACKRHWYTFDPRHVRFVDEVPTSGRRRLVPAAEAPPVLARPWDRFISQRTLMVRYDEDWHWDWLRHPWRPSDPPALVVIYEEAGEVLGFAVYSVEQHGAWRPGPDQRVTVHQFAWLTPAAHRALVRYFIGHDLVDEIRMYRMPVDDPLFHHVQEPRLLNSYVLDGTLVRIVDLPAALSGRGYDADGRLCFALHDDLCPWNSGTWQLSVEGGVGRAKRVTEPAELCLTPRALAILASGHEPATALARMGLITDADAGALRAADALFRTACAPFCAHDF